MSFTKLCHNPRAVNCKSTHALTPNQLFVLHDKRSLQLTPFWWTHRFTICIDERPAHL
jgi:hypothetical protein